MFDVGFWELVMIGVVALVVVGPERLPRMARVAGLWLGRARRVLGSVKAEIDRELKADELREILRKQAESNPLETILEESRSTAPRAVGRAATASTDAIVPAAKVAASPDLAPSQPAAPGPGPSVADPHS
ncbi:MAG TPA: Sec-independent protein translocase protein TatB [Chromatiaceae bacterium]|nr:Sec-independent protein translocase protein TatB [Chromatiaceae bacterium]